MKLNKQILFSMLMITCIPFYGQITKKNEPFFINDNLFDNFLKCTPYQDSLFSGNDTLIRFDNKEKISIINEYVNGRKIRATGYYDNEQKYRETNFNGYKRDGTDLTWYKNGRIKSFMYLQNGRMLYPYFTFYINGMLEKYTDYDRVSNKIFTKEWDMNGKISQESISIDSTDDGWTVKTYYASGGLLRIANYNVPKGNWAEYYENGQIGMLGYIENNPFCQIGNWKEWHKNGQLSREYYFKSDTPNIRDSTWSWWDESGKLIKQEIYSNGKLIDQLFYIGEKKE